jgi:hypothetical protein
MLLKEQSFDHQKGPAIAGQKDDRTGDVMKGVGVPGFSYANVHDRLRTTNYWRLRMTYESTFGRGRYCKECSDNLRVTPFMPNKGALGLDRRI